MCPNHSLSVGVQYQLSNIIIYSSFLNSHTASHRWYLIYHIYHFWAIPSLCLHLDLIRVSLSSWPGALNPFFFSLVSHNLSTVLDVAISPSIQYPYATTINITRIWAFYFSWPPQVIYRYLQPGNDCWWCVASSLIDPLSLPQMYSSFMPVRP